MGIITKAVLVGLFVLAVPTGYLIFDQEVSADEVSKAGNVLSSKTGSVAFKAAAVPEGTDICSDAQVKYFAYETADASFGPAVLQRDVQEVLAELYTRRCQDPALVVAHNEYANRAYGTLEARDALVASLAENRQVHNEAVLGLMAREDQAVKVEIRHIETDNLSMWMTDTKPRPTIVAGPSNVRTFDALVFVYEDGSEDIYKLDCGFQPMAPEFPGVPELPPPTETPTTTVPTPTPTTTVPTPSPTTTLPPQCPGDKPRWNGTECVPALNGGTTIAPPAVTAPTETTPVVTSVTIPATAAPEITPSGVVPVLVPPPVISSSNGNTGVVAPVVPGDADTGDGDVSPGGGQTGSR